MPKPTMRNSLLHYHMSVSLPNHTQQLYSSLFQQRAIISMNSGNSAIFKHIKSELKVCYSNCNAIVVQQLSA